MLLVLLGCATECLEGFELAADGNCYALTEPAGDPALEAPALLRRTSLDLLGRLPSVEDLDEVDSRPAALRRLRQEMLQDPAAEERLVEILGERWHTLVDDFTVQALELGLDEYAFERSVGEEPLRLMARIGVEDRPWTDIVRADFTMANDTLVELWPLEREEGGTWSVGHYTDGRPAAGVLATNGLFWRYRTTVSNANRGRAAAVMKLTVCDDIGSRPVSFDVGDSLVEAGTAVAIQQNPSCVACHVTLEPLASSLFGWYWFESFNGLETGAYHTEREPLGEEFLGVGGGWYGQPVDGLASLGAAIAADPRFARCQAQAFSEALWADPLEDLEDLGTLDLLVEQWKAEGLRLSALLELLLAAPAYASAPPRILSADQLSTMVEDLTGFSWRSEGFELMHSDTRGYRIMAGGVDGRFVLTASDEPSLTWALVVKRLAEASSAYAVDQGTFFTVASAQTTPDEQAFEDQLSEWAWRLTADEADREGLTELWWAVQASSGSDQAWAAVMTAMLRDPSVVVY